MKSIIRGFCVVAGICLIGPLLAACSNDSDNTDADADAIRNWRIEYSRDSKGGDDKNNISMVGISKDAKFEISFICGGGHSWGLTITALQDGLLSDEPYPEGTLHVTLAGAAIPTIFDAGDWQTGTRGEEHLGEALSPVTSISVDRIVISENKITQDNGEEVTRKFVTALIEADQDNPRGESARAMGLDNAKLWNLTVSAKIIKTDGKPLYMAFLTRGVHAFVPDIRKACGTTR
jgi:hypothetical protein